MMKWLKNVVFAAATLSIAVTPLILSSCTFTVDPEPQPEPTPPQPEPVEPYLNSITITLPQESFWLQQSKTEKFDDPISIECLDQNKNPIEAETQFILLNLDGTKAPDWIWIDEENKINISAQEEPALFEFFIYAESINKNIQSEMHKISVEIIELQPIAPESIEIVGPNNTNLFYTDTLNLELGLKVKATDVPEELISKDCSWELTSIEGKKIVDLNQQPLFKLEEIEGKQTIIASSNVDSTYIGNYKIKIRATSILNPEVFDDISINVSMVDGFYFYDSDTKYTYTRTSLQKNWALSLIPSDTYTLDNIRESIYQIPVDSIAQSLSSSSGATKISTIILPNSIKYVYASAFADQTYLYSLAMPGVIYLGIKAFYNCLNVSFLRNYAEPCLWRVDEKAFYGCTSLTFSESTIHNFTFIGDYAFNKVPLTTFNVGKDITSFGIEPFSNCPTLQFINVLNPVPPKMSSSLYSGTTDLKYIRVPLNSVETYQKASGWAIYKDKIIGF